LGPIGWLVFGPAAAEPAVKPTINAMNKLAVVRGPN
jgi:hypothetical protein